MNLATFSNPSAPTCIRPPLRGAEDHVRCFDPFSEDRADDPPILTTERRLMRLALLSAEAALRIDGQGGRADVAKWLLQPLTLFDNRRAVDAGQELMPFARGMLFNGLALGADVDPRVIDELIADRGFDDDAEARSEVALYEEVASETAQLFSCYVHGPSGLSGRKVRAMWAMMAASEEAARRRLALRFGQQAAREADVRPGFEPYHPSISSMLTDDVAELLAYAALHPDRAAAAEFEFYIDLRKMD